MLQTTTEHSPFGNVHCPRCDTILPPHAIFCGSCGERIGKEKKGPSLTQDGADATPRYHITSLVRHRPYVKLFFAVDNQQQRMVVIRSVDISSLNEEAQAKASELTQREYDLLRQQSIAHVMPVIDLQESQSHLLTITGQPLLDNTSVDAGGQKDTVKPLRTLQDFLQSSKGLLDQQLALSWISRLCQSLEGLHKHQIVIGDLDPYAILLDGDDHTIDREGPWLAVSWLPPQLSRLLPRIANEQKEISSASVLATSFSAPEVLLGKVEPVSDVYSLGAILYLLLTGTQPDGLMQRTQQRLRSPHELNPRISGSFNEIVMQALSLEPSERFQSVKELAEALSSRHSSQALKAYPIPHPPVQKSNHALRRDQNESGLSLSYDEPGQDNSWHTGTSLVQHLTKQISGMLPAIPHLPKQITGMLSTAQHASQTQVEQPQVRMWASSVPQAAFLTPKQNKVSKPTDGTNPAESYASLLKHIQRVLVGERLQITTAATIENPLRVQPDQGFNIRISLMGRDEPDPGILPRGRVFDPSRPHSRLYGTMEGIQASGLGARVHDELVYVEVRSAIHEHYAYIVQQAAVKIPAQGYIVDIVIPMQPFSRKSNGRRERLHVFFFDEKRRPLYERPFVLEILVSYLVQPGREGHHVLPIPQ